MARVYYVGDWAVQLGPVYAETPFNHTPKGLDLINYGKWLVSAVESSGRHEIVSVPTWEFYTLPPGEYEKILETCDIIVFSDVESKNFQLHPQFFDRHQFGKTVLTFPDRIRLTVDAIRAGTGAVFLGGWLSFTGEMGKGGWGRTRLAEVLPCRCRETDDLRESTEGFRARPLAPEHPLLAGVDLTTMPPVLGYNRVLPREGFDVIAAWESAPMPREHVPGTGDPDRSETLGTPRNQTDTPIEDPDPAITCGAVGRGRVLSYTSDPAPHWGCNFVFWEQYNAFWTNVCDWLTDG